VFNLRAVRTAGVVAGIAALVCGVFAGSAFAWYCKGNGGKDVPTSSSGPHSEKGGNDYEHGDKPSGGDKSGGEDKPSGGYKPGGEDKPGGEEKPSEGNQPAPPPVVASTPAPSAVPVGTGLLPAAPHPAAVESPAPAAVPATPAAVTSPPVVKGEIGTAYNGSGGEVPTVLAATGEVAQSAGQGGGLARTGFGLLPMAMLGGFALLGSAFFFRRFQKC
jgi:hypothetical protein